jgi:multidrug transporter EmrE-like cation transporter
VQNFLYALPSIVLIGTANALLKWRSTFLAKSGVHVFGHKSLEFVFDPFIFLGAIATLASVLWWLKIVSKVQVSIVYPMIQGGAIILTLTIASTLLSEHLNVSQFFGIIFVILGICFLSAS